MRPPDIDLTPLYIGDYIADTMALTAEQHVVFQRSLLQLWLQQPLALKDSWLQKQSRLSQLDWGVLRPLLSEILKTALIGVHHWNEAVKAYDGQRLPSFEWQILRTIVLARDDYACVYCGQEEDLHVDHRIPLARGGSNRLDNLVIACGPCNQCKGSTLVDDWLNRRSMLSIRSRP